MYCRFPSSAFLCVSASLCQEYPQSVLDSISLAPMIHWTFISAMNPFLSSPADTDLFHFWKPVPLRVCPTHLPLTHHYTNDICTSKDAFEETYIPRRYYMLIWCSLINSLAGEKEEMRKQRAVLKQASYWPLYFSIIFSLYTFCYEFPSSFLGLCFIFLPVLLSHFLWFFNRWLYTFSPTPSLKDSRDHRADSLHFLCVSLYLCFSSALLLFRPPPLLPSPFSTSHVGLLFPVHPPTHSE